MNKTRLENLSDGVFAIVMTLLIIEIKIPDIYPLSNRELLDELGFIVPLFVSYFVSFVVLISFWLGHHALFHFFSKNVNRVLVVINMFFLMFVSVVPFSAHLIGTYSQNQPAVIIYGTNIFILGAILLLMFTYAIRSKEIENEDVPLRTRRQARIRILLPPVFALFGILASFYDVSVSLLLFAFPILFNVIPGALNAVERLVHFNLE